jgi:transketolase
LAGIATSVGMAIGEKWLAQRYNLPGFDIFDYRIYAVCGDGCLMEGVGSEAASLAGHLGLDNLCWIYDNNHITIEGDTRIAFTEDVACRFLGYGWNVLRVGDANDLGRIENALRTFRQTRGRPTLIILDSHIGYGAPRKQDTAAAHGGRSAKDEVRLTKRATGGLEDANSSPSTGSRSTSRPGVGARCRGRPSLDRDVRGVQGGAPRARAGDRAHQHRELPAGGTRTCPPSPADPKGIAGREASSKVLNVLARNIPWFLGGSATSAVEQDPAHLPRRGGLPGRQPGREEPAFRHPRARDGGRGERAGAEQDPRVRRHLLPLQ